MAAALEKFSSIPARSAAIRASITDCELFDFSKPSQLLEFAQNNPACDIAFLDIHMRGMGGLSFSEKIDLFLMNVSGSLKKNQMDYLYKKYVSNWGNYFFQLET